MLQKILFAVGARLRNPSLYEHYHALKESERWSLASLRRQQWRRLESLLRFARSHSPYYRERLTGIGWDEHQPLSEDAFQRIPKVSKKDLIARNEDIHSKYDFSRTFLCETSGTSGDILTFRRDERWDSFNRASVLRGYSWYGVRPWESNIYFWGYNLDSAAERRVRIFDRLVNRYRIFDYSPEAMDAFKKRIGQVAYIEGYSSMIYEYARRLQHEGGVQPKRLKLIKGTSEKIFPHYQPVVEEVFGMPIVSEYGAAESGMIAFECPHGRMHINTEGVYVETEADGSIVVTNLLSRSFPVIRYQLGDVVRLASDEGRCPCGMQHPVIQEVTGRIGKSIVGRTSEFPSLTLYYIFKNLYFEHGIELNYQGRQSEPGKLQIAVREDPSWTVRKILLAECEKYFGSDVDLSFSFGTDFGTEREKTRDFVSKL